MLGARRDIVSFRSSAPHPGASATRHLAVAEISSAPSAGPDEARLPLPIIIGGGAGGFVVLVIALFLVRRSKRATRCVGDSGAYTASTSTTTTTTITTTTTTKAKQVPEGIPEGYIPAPVVA